MVETGVDASLSRVGLPRLLPFRSAMEVDGAVSDVVEPERDSPVPRVLFGVQSDSKLAEGASCSSRRRKAASAVKSILRQTRSAESSGYSYRSNPAARRKKSVKFIIEDKTPEVGRLISVFRSK